MTRMGGAPRRSRGLRIVPPLAVLATTLQIAVSSTSGCLLAGTFLALALALAFVPFRGSRCVTRLIETVVSFPSFLIPLAFGILYGRAGVDGPPRERYGRRTGHLAALAAHSAPASVRKVTDALFHLPAAVPSVVIGLGLLTAFSRQPLVLNGTVVIVVLAQTLLVLTFAYNTVAAAARTADPMMGLVAASLGARTEGAADRPASPPGVVDSRRHRTRLRTLHGRTRCDGHGLTGELANTSHHDLRPLRPGKHLPRGANTLVLIGATLIVLILIARARGRTEAR